MGTMVTRNLEPEQAKEKITFKTYISYALGDTGDNIMFSTVDVYKRQADGAARNREDADYGTDCEGMSDWAGGLYPVSYTHLDVYKRQADAQFVPGQLFGSAFICKGALQHIQFAAFPGKPAGILRCFVVPRPLQDRCDPGEQNGRLVRLCYIIVSAKLKS